MIVIYELQIESNDNNNGKEMNKRKGLQKTHTLIHTKKWVTHKYKYITKKIFKKRRAKGSKNKTRKWNTYK